MSLPYAPYMGQYGLSLEHWSLSSHGYADYYPDGKVVDHHRGTAYADEGQRYAGYRQDAYVHPHVFDKMEHEHGHEPGYHVGTELVLGKARDIEAPQQKCGEQQHQGDSPDKAQLFPHNRKDGVCFHLRDIVYRPSIADTHPGELTPSDMADGHEHLVGAGVLISGGINEGEYTVYLVFLQNLNQHVVPQQWKAQQRSPPKIRIMRYLIPYTKSMHRNMKT